MELAASHHARNLAISLSHDRGLDGLSKKNNDSRISYTISEDHTNHGAVRRKRLCAFKGPTCRNAPEKPFDAAEFPNDSATWTNGPSNVAPMPILPTIRPISPLSDAVTAVELPFEVNGGNMSPSYGRIGVHTPGHDPGDTGPGAFACDQCPRVFDQVYRLNRHKRLHERPYACPYPGCSKKFGTKTHHDRHFNDKHNKTRKFHCTEPDCPYSRQGGKSFPRKDNWRRHMVHKHGVTKINGIPSSEWDARINEVTAAGASLTHDFAPARIDRSNLPVYDAANSITTAPDSDDEEEEDWNTSYMEESMGSPVDFRPMPPLKRSDNLPKPAIIPGVFNWASPRMASPSRINASHLLTKRNHTADPLQALSKSAERPLAGIPTSLISVTAGPNRVAKITDKSSLSFVLGLRAR